MDRRFTINKDLILDKIVPTSTYERGPTCAIKDIADDLNPAGGIIQVDCHRPMQTWTTDVVEVIMSDDRATLGPVTPHVKRAHISRFKAYLVDFIQLDDMIVPAQLNGVVRSVMNFIVSNPIAYT
jgi:hypothetical protein